MTIDQGTATALAVLVGAITFVVGLASVWLQAVIARSERGVEALAMRVSAIDGRSPNLRQLASEHRAVHLRLPRLAYLIAALNLVILLLLLQLEYVWLRRTAHWGYVGIGQAGPTFWALASLASVAVAINLLYLIEVAITQRRLNVLSESSPATRLRRALSSLLAANPEVAIEATQRLVAQYPYSAISWLTLSYAFAREQELMASKALAEIALNYTVPASEEWLIAQLLRAKATDALGDTVQAGDEIAAIARTAAMAGFDATLLALLFNETLIATGEPAPALLPTDTALELLFEHVGPPSGSAAWVVAFYRLARPRGISRTLELRIAMMAFNLGLPGVSDSWAVWTMSEAIRAIADRPSDDPTVGPVLQSAFAKHVATLT